MATYRETANNDTFLDAARTSLLALGEEDPGFDRKNIIGTKFYPVYLDEVESYDIDNPIEFKIAEKIFLMENE